MPKVRVKRSKRNHYRHDGAEKRPYTRQEADLAVEEMAARNALVQSYLCGSCRHWHVGKWWRGQPEDNRLPMEFYIELGTRVCGCMRSENLGSSQVRFNNIMKHAKGMLRRRLQILVDAHERERLILRLRERTILSGS